MRSACIRIVHDRAGNTLVELALIVPVLIAIALAIIDFGRGAHASMSLRSAARVGAEYVSRTGDVDAVTTVVANAANLDVEKLVVTPVVFCECDGGVAQTCGTFCPDGTAARRFISITARQPFSTLVPYPMIDSPLQLSGSATLRVQ
ncbi:MAG TPA: TadE/TadG family type IV pilus assembly protein [Alphaproteobacteria bacterium]|nr:TadE/TadG family type IV pilus assembly protein [Alphaproteobacteria bacterium]